MFGDPICIGLEYRADKQTNSVENPTTTTAVGVRNDSTSTPVFGTTAYPHMPILRPQAA